jgi:hypothetical protein
MRPEVVKRHFQIKLRTLLKFCFVSNFESLSSQVRRYLREWSEGIYEGLVSTPSIVFLLYGYLMILYTKQCGSSNKDGCFRTFKSHIYLIKISNYIIIANFDQIHVWLKSPKATILVWRTTLLSIKDHKIPI